jgi:hypothetical protein
MTKTAPVSPTTSLMKISTETLLILKNLADINKGILITPGNQLRTRTKAIFAEATIAEDFPLEVGIYDLKNFLSVVALFKEPEFDFQEQFLLIAEANGLAETRYAYAGSGMVQLTTKRKKTDMPNDTINFVLSEDQWITLGKAMSVFQKPEIKIYSDGDEVRIGTENHKQPSSNAYSIKVDGEAHCYKCNMIFAWDNMKLLKGAYEVTVTPTFTQFRNTSGYDLTYLIAVDPNSSTFGGE